jgi:hypothetical protein
VKWLALLLWCWPLTASAHPLVDRGVRDYEQAEFDRALRSLDRAERARNLTRADLVALYRCRALVHAALDSEEAMEADLLRFASLDESGDLGRDAPPRLRRVFERVRERAREPISLNLEVTIVGDGMRLAAEVGNDVAALTREVRLRVKSRGEWQDAEGSEIVLVSLGEDEVVEYYAEAIGPGRAVLVAEGAHDRPRRITRAEIAAQSDALRTATSVRTLSSPPLADDGAGDSDSAIGWWVAGGVGAAVVIAGVIVIALVASAPNDDTDLAPPIGDFP